MVCVHAFEELLQALDLRLGQALSYDLVMAQID
jgi:hypothetical protein